MGERLFICRTHNSYPLFAKNFYDPDEPDYKPAGLASPIKGAAVFVEQLFELNIQEKYIGHELGHCIGMDEWRPNPWTRPPDNYMTYSTSPLYILGIMPDYYYTSHQIAEIQLNNKWSVG